MSEQDRGNSEPGNDGNPGQGGGNPAQGNGNEKAAILVDNVHHKVREGNWIVSDLKAAVGVDPAKVLAEITPRGLNDLEDGASIQIRNGMRFMSHARTGASS